MPTIDANLWSSPSTSIIHRPFGGLVGYRRISDRASRAVVHAFMMSELPAVSAAGLLSAPGAYVLTDGRTAYIGESGKPSRRLANHSTDPTKAFARDVFVVGGCDGAPFDKLLAVDLQFRLTRCAVETGAVAVSKGLNPAEPGLTDDDRATHDRIAADALRLLNDAGCRIFRAVLGEEVAGPPEPPPPDDGADAADSGPMSIGVSTTPLGTDEFELRFGGLWARGYWAGDHFVVAAGSEVRSQTNDSVNAITRTRRGELRKAGVLAAIPGVADRRRLIVAVAFPSESIAAKVVCGAHTAGRWISRSPSKAVWLAA
jgi:hypothetical protein